MTVSSKCHQHILTTHDGRQDYNYKAIGKQQQ